MRCNHWKTVNFENFRKARRKWRNLECSVGNQLHDDYQASAKADVSIFKLPYKLHRYSFLTNLISRLSACSTSSHRCVHGISFFPLTFPLTSLHSSTFGLIPRYAVSAPFTTQRGYKNFRSPVPRKISTPLHSPAGYFIRGSHTPGSIFANWGLLVNPAR